MAPFPRAQRHRPIPARDTRRESRRAAELQRTKTRHQVERHLRYGR